MNQRAAHLPLLLICAAVIISIRLYSQDSCGQTTGHTERSEYYAAPIETRMFYTVYLPPCYDEIEADLPVLYLMHGSNDDDGHWLRLGLKDLLDAQISSGEYPPMIVVLPFANWIGNENRFDAASWNAVFVDQFMPLVEGAYRIDENHRAIGGISRGGFWAFQIAFRFPEMFEVVGGHSAFFDRYHAPPQYNPLNLAMDAPGIERLQIALDYGADDYARPGLEIMHENLLRRGVEHQYTVYPEGQHNNVYWGAHIEDYLNFYVENWREQPSADGTPSMSQTQPSGSLFVTNTPHPPNVDMGILGTPTQARPLAQVAPTSDPDLQSQSYYLLLPAVVFPSRQYALPTGQLRHLRAGIYDPKLVLSEAVATTLAEQFNVTLAPETRVVTDDTLYNTLYRDRTLYTLLPFDQLTLHYRILHLDEEHPLDTDLSTYPFAFATEDPNFEAALLTRIAFSGVTALTRDTIPALDREGLDWAASGIVDYVTRPDFFHTSNEVSIHPECPAYLPERLGPFCSKAEHFELLEKLDVDIVELSGNHNNDYGYTAYTDTLRWYADHGIATTAGGETEADAKTPLIIEHNGNRIALLSCNLAGPYYAWVNEDATLAGGVRPGAAQCDNDWLRETLSQLSAENDVVFFSLQHIEFDQYTPSPEQRVNFRQYASWGADVVLGTQSHFPQVFEFAPGADPGEETLLHYGLGNLFFDQQFFGGVRFFVDQFFVYDGRLLTVDLFPGIIEGQGRPRPMTPDERENFLYLIFTQQGGM